MLDRPPVFEDPLALAIAGFHDEAALRAGVADSETHRLASFLRAFLAARSRLAEDELLAAAARGARVYVVLGAGLDTFAYRQPRSLHEMRVVEVDHPSTQAWKRRRLEAAGIAIPGNLTWIAIDFGLDTLARALADADVPGGSPVFFSWLGVVPYLAEDEVYGTLRVVASMPRESAVVFDYAPPPDRLGPAGRAAFEALSRRVAQAGEPFRTFLEPGRLAARLGELGFGKVEDLDGDAINARYFAGRTDGLRVGNLGRFAIARV